MVPDDGEGTTQGPSAEEEAAFVRYGVELADAADAVLADWVERCVMGVLAAQGVSPDAAVLVDAAEAGAQAVAAVIPELRALLARDLEEQATGPLAILRVAVRYPTEVLDAAGARPAVRDEFAVRAFPGDVYALSPAAFADIDERLHDPGLRWGAAKAYLHLARRRAQEG